MLNSDAPPHWKAQNLASARHGFFGREGGVSAGVYATLNAGTGSQDDPLAVSENRRRIAAAFDLASERLVGVHQVHSAKAVFVETPWRGERPEADALVATSPGLALSVLTADCAPVLMADAETGVIGAAHAGWRGAIGGVLEATVALMREHGARRISAAVGPCIQQASYEVGPEFEARFLSLDESFARFFSVGRGGGRSLFDLPGFCAARLKACSVSEVEVMPLDTYTLAASLHSHRRSVHEGLSDYGRNCAVIALPSA